MLVEAGAVRNRILTGRVSSIELGCTLHLERDFARDRDRTEHAEVREHRTT